MQRCIGPILQICRNSGLPIAMIPCLHQSHDYIKRKLRVWRAQKCNFLVGAKTVPTGTGLQTTPFHAAPYTSDNANLRKFGSAYRHSTVFAPKQWLFQKEATGMESPKMQFPSRCKDRTDRYGSVNYPVSCCAVRVDNANLRKFGSTYCHGTGCAPNQWLHQKEATGMESPKM